MPWLNASLTLAVTRSRNGAMVVSSTAESISNDGVITRSSTGRNNSASTERLAAEAVGRGEQHLRRRDLETASERLDRLAIGRHDRAQHVLAGRQLMRLHHLGEDDARVAHLVRGHVGVQERRRVRRRRHLVLHRHALGAGAVGLDVAVDRAEVDLVADCRRQDLPALERPAHHQLAERNRARGGQPGMNRVLDGADALAFDRRQLHRVLARRQARAGGELQRRRHAGHHRQQPHVDRLAVDQASVLVGDHVAERDDLRSPDSRCRRRRESAAGPCRAPAPGARTRRRAAAAPMPAAASRAPPPRPAAAPARRARADPWPC